MTTPLRYPQDNTGVSPDNLVSGEVHTLSTNRIRALAPTYNPYFTESLRVWDNANNRELVKNQGYSIAELDQAASIMTGKEIASVILITDETVSDKVRIDYQTLGGLFTQDVGALVNMYETLLQDSRGVNWDDIIGKWTEYPPTLHRHLLLDIYGFEPLVTGLERLRQGILLSNTPAYQAMLDYIANQTQQQNTLIAQLGDQFMDALEDHIASSNAHGSTYVATVAQTLTALQKTAARTNIDVYSKAESDQQLAGHINDPAAHGANYVSTLVQSLTTGQQTQARNNILAPSTQQVTDNITTAIDVHKSDPDAHGTNYVATKEQTLSTTQKNQARLNLDVPSTATVTAQVTDSMAAHVASASAHGNNYVSANYTQGLNAAQQNQARFNMNVYSQAETQSVAFQLITDRFAGGSPGQVWMKNSGGQAWGDIPKGTPTHWLRLLTDNQVADGNWIFLRYDGGPTGWALTNAGRSFQVIDGSGAGVWRIDVFIRGSVAYTTGIILMKNGNPMAWQTCDPARSSSTYSYSITALDGFSIGDHLEIAGSGYSGGGQGLLYQGGSVILVTRVA